MIRPFLFGEAISIAQGVKADASVKVGSPFINSASMRPVVGPSVWP